MITRPTCRLGSQFQQVVFAVSTGRTATNALSAYLPQVYPSVTGLHEPKPARMFRIVSNMHLCGKISEPTVARLLYLARRKRINELKGGTYFEANGFLHGCLDAFDHTFHNVKVIHIVRHPITYIRSHINHGAFLGLKGMAGRLMPYWLLKPDYYDQRSGLKWYELSFEERLAWRWVVVNQALERGESLFGDRYLRVRYEDLFADSGQRLGIITNWLGLPYDERISTVIRSQRYNASKRDTARPLEDWPGRVREHVYSLCESQMARYGYERI